ncbi:hypothetical protein CJF39_12720 [Pseudomonas lundensis]|uniref:Glycosyl hydrolase family 13 catalytic domain-containing protein n=1 Tax=Pseudomonas lundensis TaxID=86185 RepID=A0A266N981_9PSED|nr:alpha-amylase family glycosyl hydrolase [Pseudomonas lundensis]OZY59061.1 hypothetical protein CJF39_12720 [Pseudomonas lundensis]
MHDWQRSVIYQIYPKSFYSHAGNATGDLLGVVDKLDYLQWLGVDYLWLTPFLRSPQRDNGYDISDYYAIDPSYGSMADCELLILEARARGIKLMLDIVVNHTSTEHPWFQQARSSLDNPYRDFYIWRDQPNNWHSKFGGSAWEYEAQTGQYYLHLFDHTQADLNWDNPTVRAEVYKLMRFWRDKGVGGFRLDVINLISKPADFAQDDSDGRRFYTDGPRVHAYLQEMHREVFAGHDLVSVGEMSSTSLQHCIRYSNPQSRELSMTFNFHYLKVDYPNQQKWVHGDVETLNIYRLKRDAGETHAGCMAAIMQKSRDNGRTPMQWDHQPNAGFSSARPWIDLPDNAARITVQDQRNDPSSVLHHYRHLIALRRAEPLLQHGKYHPLLLEHPHVWAYLREGDDERLLVLNNFYGMPCDIELPAEVISEHMPQRVLISNYDDCPQRTRRITLRPYESFVLHVQS